VGQIAEKAVFLTILHCIFSAELTKMHSFRLFFGNFAHRERILYIFFLLSLLLAWGCWYSCCGSCTRRCPNKFLGFVGWDWWRKRNGRNFCTQLYV